MLVSHSWLSEYIDLSGLTTTEVSDLLTFAGIEVEGIEERGVSSEKVVVAQILTTEKHPQADRLKVCQVDAGEGKPRQIVCGAPNCQAGDKVPCALPGAILPGNFEIKEGKLRGIDSLGMLCSGRELSLPDNVDGLMILSPSEKVGMPIRELFSSDTIFELEITPNRPDLLSHWGLARELSALTGRELKADPAPNGPKTVPAEKAVRLESKNCPIYTATKISGVKIASSPEWLQARLSSIGLRPINNIVDITNFVLHELGAPLHAFDAAKISGSIIVRQAADGEQIEALDGKNYQLTNSDLVIADESGKAQAIAGVMGGAESGVAETTTDIILEGAYFQSTAIRATARRLILSSDSSYRFERGTSPENTLRAVSRATELILQIAGGQQVGATFLSGKCPKLTGCVELKPARLAQMTGNSVQLSEAEGILSKLGLKKLTTTSWEIPSWRLDLTRPVDLIEEIVRVVGLDRIPCRQKATFVTASTVDEAYDFQFSLRQRLSSLGIFEIQTIKLIAESANDGTIAKASDALTINPLLPGDIIKVSLPLSEDHAIMRPSLAPGLVATAARNARHGASYLRFFEIGRTFRNAGGGKATDLESDTLGILIAGTTQPKSWAMPAPAIADNADLLAIVETLAAGMPVRLVPNNREGFALSANIQIAGKPVGILARLSLARCRELDLPAAVYLVEIDLKKLQDLLPKNQKVVDLPQFPGSSRDIAMELPADLPNADIEKALLKLKEPLLNSFACFDLFSDPSGEKLPKDRKSVAYTFLYRANDRTLTSSEVDTAHQNLRNHLEKSISSLSFR